MTRGDDLCNFALPRFLEDMVQCKNKKMFGGLQRPATVTTFTACCAECEHLGSSRISCQILQVRLRPHLPAPRKVGEAGQVRNPRLIIGARSSLYAKHGDSAEKYTLTKKNGGGNRPILGRFSKTWPAVSRSQFSHLCFGRGKQFLFLDCQHLCAADAGY